MTLFDECIEALSDDFSLLTEEEEKEMNEDVKEMFHFFQEHKIIMP